MKMNNLLKSLYIANHDANDRKFYIFLHWKLRLMFTG